MIIACCFEYQHHLDFALWVDWTPSFKWSTSTISDAHQESCYSQETGISIYMADDLRNSINLQLPVLVSNT